MAVRMMTAKQRQTIIRICRDSTKEAAEKAVDSAMLTRELAQRILASGDRLRDPMELAIGRFICHVSIDLREEKDHKGPNITDVTPVGAHRLIDCDSVPFIPDDWSIVEHKKGGQMEFDPAKIAFHLDEGQQNSRTIQGKDLREKLKDKAVMNACVLDYLLANTTFIPDQWKSDKQGRIQFIYFWGTIYRGSDGRLYVRCLCWNDGRWRWGYCWFSDHWDDRSPAAVLAS